MVNYNLDRIRNYNKNINVIPIHYIYIKINIIKWESIINKNKDQCLYQVKVRYINY